MRTRHRPLALLAALTTLAAPAALVANELDPSQQFQLDDGTSGGTSKPCRYGSTIPCGSETIETCTERSIQPGIGPGGVTFTWYCVTKKITTTTFYKDD